MKNTRSRLSTLVDSLYLSGDPELDFFYLGGAMTNKKFFNYPEFDRIANILRCNGGYNIISAAEIVGPVVREECFSCNTGDYSDIKGDWKTFMGDMLTVLCMPACIGAIFIPGWRVSQGSNTEIKLLQKLGKQVWEFCDDNGTGNPGLIHIDVLDDSTDWCSSPGAVEIAPNYRLASFG